MLQALFGLTCCSWRDPRLTAGLGCSCARREDNIIELRKNKRDENLQKKRMVHGGPSYAMEESSARTGMALQNKVGREAARVCAGVGVCWGGGWPAVRLCWLPGPGPALGDPITAVLTTACVFLHAATGRAAHEGAGAVQPELPGAV